MSAARPAARPRIALLAGTLAQGGAETQLVYMARGLLEAGADVRVLTLTQGDFFEPVLRTLGVEPVWVGKHAHPALRTAAVAAALRAFRPHVVQAAHFYTNLYAGLVAPLYGAIAVGAVRGDLVRDVESNGRWSRWLLRAPAALIANSHAAARNAAKYDLPPHAVHVLPNVLDLAAFDVAAAVEPRDAPALTAPAVVGVGSFIRAKRFDRFLHVIARARAQGAALHGLLIGDGPERAALEALAATLGLTPHAVTFAGRRTDVPALLRRAHVHLLTSDHEGFPNVLLEAMAARLPVVATAAGDADVIVEPEVTGYVTPCDAIDQLVDHVVSLARDPELRARLGACGRRRVEERYACAGLGARILGIHRRVAERAGNRRVLAALPS
ncbi:MAG: glycosyltransferase [Gemmatimonadaceae bacterium]|nr:glycosyltransferase [Gemmatimonadaceae bacterium]